MSAQRVEEFPPDPPKTDRQLMEEIHSMLSEFHAWAAEVMPTIRLMSEEMKRGGIMGLMGAMMRPPKG